MLGGGSWGTTVASLVCRDHETVVWTREPELADEIDERHHNKLFLSGFALHARRCPRVSEPARADGTPRRRSCGTARADSR